ncbi:hypothetical protein [Pseudoalteromonas sp.]|uniref:hypothetical protein n=1 Tax=Pseudoalteromonas sp. TaxID=53249 RepID=UPI003561FDD1
MVRFACLLFILASPLVWGVTVDEQLKEAKDYLTVKPSESYRILESIDLTANLTEEQLIEWYILYMRASLPLGKLDNLIDSVANAFEYHKSDYFSENITTITSALGIWLRRNNYLIDAELSFKCSYRNASNDRLRVILNNSIALLARENQDLDRAKSLFEYSARLAEAGKNINMMGMINFNQGVIAFQEKKFALAEQHFRKALDHYQSINKQSGKILAATYLLFSFVVQKELTNYQRLYSPTFQQTEAFPNVTSKALLAWVHAGYLHHIGSQINDEMRNSLLTQFKNITDHHEQKLIEKHLAKPLGISLKLPEVKVHVERFNARWFALVRQCNFNQIVHP